MTDDQHTTHRSPRELVLHDLREWAKDVAHQGRTGVSPLEAVRQLALTQKSVVTGVAETRSHRVVTHDYVRRLPYTSQRVDADLRKICRIDPRYYRIAKFWAATGSINRAAAEAKMSRGEATAMFEAVVALMLAFNGA